MGILPRSNPSESGASRHRRAGRWVALALFPLAPIPASAHTTNAIPPDRLLVAWTADPLMLVLALLAGWLYAHGLGRLNQVGRQTGRGAVIGRTRILAFGTGVLTLVVALASPLDTATATVFSAHMVQHVLLIAVAPPLILLGQPMTVLANGLPRRWRRPLARLPRRAGIAPLVAVLTMPIVAWFLHAGTLWLWHIPQVYDAAVASTGLHALEHATFVLTAFLYWWTIIPASPRARNALEPGLGILSVFAMGMQGAALGVILTFAGDPLYPIYIGRSELWGVSALSDQRLAGLIMWIPAGSVYVVAALLLLRSWFRDDQPHPDAPDATSSGAPRQCGTGDARQVGPARTVP